MAETCMAGAWHRAGTEKVVKERSGTSEELCYGNGKLGCHGVCVMNVVGPWCHMHVCQDHTRGRTSPLSGSRQAGS